MNKICIIAILTVVIALLGSTLLQFGYNMLFVSPVAFETTKGGDGKLTDMMFMSDSLDDS